MYPSVVALAVALFCTPVCQAQTGTCMDCDRCDFTFEPLPDTLISEYLGIGRLYAQVVNPRKTFEDVDSICFEFTPTIAEATALLKTTYTNKDKSKVTLVAIETEVQPSGFGSIGPTYPRYKSQSAGVISIQDFTIGKPCDTVYVLKRCGQISDIEECPKTKDVPVVILSTKMMEDNTECLAEAMSIGEAAVGTLDYLTLPRTAKKPCTNSMGGAGGGGLPGGGVSDFELNLPGLLSIKF